MHSYSSTFRIKVLTFVLVVGFFHAKSEDGRGPFGGRVRHSLQHVPLWILVQLQIVPRHEELEGDDPFAHERVLWVGPEVVVPVILLLPRVVGGPVDVVLGQNMYHSVKQVTTPFSQNHSFLGRLGELLIDFRFLFSLEMSRSIFWPGKSELHSI